MMADDHHSARQAYARIIEDEDNLCVIGHAGNGVELLELVEKEEPHIVLLDLDMPVMNGTEALKILTEKYPEVKIIILSTHNEDYYISELLIMGACAYLPKNCNLEDLITTINKVNDDGFFFNKSISKLVVTSTLQDKKFNAIINQLSLTERETDVLKYVCEEKTNKQIAEFLDISTDTVDFHRKSIYRKTHSRSIVSLVKYAIKNGITSVD
jgi:DNA-binding NarL/FixJ family response regulator